MAATVRESVNDTLENLVEQFSDVYSFYRELIQNALDAGTNRVDVFLQFEPIREGSNDGVIIIHVDDYGEGMNREIIDNELTRLFSSSKENDVSKIGKFGIGFVSVFAIKPEAVNIDTSRDGQDWRILFNKDKSFERLKRDYPVDGTKIKIIKQGNRKFYEHFLSRSKETVEFWCRHSEAEIYFQDEPVNRPFDVDCLCKVSVNESAGEVVAGYTTEETPFYGFYNQGLTLLEGRKRFFPGITFKIKSKYLEHTLTRDNVREDGNYWKAMELMDRIARKILPRKLFGMIQEELLSGEEETETFGRLLDFAFPYLESKDRLPSGCAEMKFARDAEGAFITAGEMQALSKEGEILYDYRSNDVTKVLAQGKRRVIKTKSNSRLLAFLRRFSGDQPSKVLRASGIYFIPRIVEREDLSELQKGLIRSLDLLNHDMSNKTEPILFADFDYPDSCISDKVYIMQESPGELSHVSDLSSDKDIFKSGLSIFSRKKTFILNQSHKYIKGLMNLAEHDREMATYFLAKLLYIQDGIETPTDTRIAEVSMERRGA